MNTDSAVVVTGAARGLGQAIATRFAADGRAVVAIDLDEARLAATVAALPGQGHVPISGDVREEQVLERACTEAAKLGSFHCFVANAGVTGPGPSVDYPVDEWDRLLDVDLRAVFLGARTAARHRVSSIVMISSINGHLGFAGRAAYCAAKAGVQGLCRSLAVEWARDHIRVNAVSPAGIETEMLADLLKTGFGSAGTFLSRIPMGRFGQPGEIADAVAYLASDRASYITGAVLPVDGGWLANGAPGEQ
jgi:NAD(P)-dependent dehydrogenase (short-subunit alcohol dehydrogenase family)